MIDEGVDWGTYRAWLGYNACVTNEAELATRESLASFLEGIVDDPAYQAHTKINGVETPLVVTRKNPKECVIKAFPDTNLFIGDMVECFDEQWLVVEIYTDKIGLLNGKMWLCNFALKFQNFSSTIHTRYCVVDDGSYSKMSSNLKVETQNNTYDVYITMDDKTYFLYVDKRLSLGNIINSSNELIMEVYEVIGIDRVSNNHGAGSHLMVMKLQRGVYNPEVDDIENGICDKFVENEDEESEGTVGQAIIQGRNTLRVGTTTKYTAVFVDSNNEAIPNVEEVWTVTIPTGSTVTYRIIDHAVHLIAPLKESNVGTTITITLKDAGGLYGEYIKKVQVIPLG